MTESEDSALKESANKIKRLRNDKASQKLEQRIAQACGRDLLSHVSELDNSELAELGTKVAEKVLERISHMFGGHVVQEKEKKLADLKSRYQDLRLEAKQINERVLSFVQKAQAMGFESTTACSRTKIPKLDL